MLEEFQKIIDVESLTAFFKEKIGEPLGENIDFASVINHVGGIKIFDFLIATFKPEYNMQGLWHEQEINQIKKKFERCVTIEQKKRYLETKLEEHEILFQEHEYFEMMDDLKDSTFNELFNKFSQVRHGFTKTSRWLNASEDDKALLAIVDVIPSKLPTEEELSVFQSPQYIRQNILSNPLKYRFFQKLMSIKKGEIPPSQLIMDIVSDVFSMFYASKVNVYLREEYQKLIPKSDYQLAEIVEEIKEEQSGRKIDIFLPKIKERRGNDTFTSLSLTQTAVFFNMLRQEKVIFKDESYQTKENIYKAIQVLTGYSRQTLKEAMNISRPEETDKVVTLKMFEKLSRC